MSTLIENINDIVDIKNDLNDLLLENGVNGGELFDTYPEKFRALFRLLQDMTEEAVQGYESTVETITEVAVPVITYDNNIVTITCATKDSYIYYWTKGLKTGWLYGEAEYVNRFYVTEDTYVEAYALDKSKQIRSGTAWVNVPYVLGAVPATPVITRDGTSVTITCDTVGAVIYWSTMQGNWTQYSSAVTVARTSDVWAYAVKDGVASEYAFDAAPEQAEKPATPVMTYQGNTVTVTCDTDGATIYWKCGDDQGYTLYEGPFEIEKSGWYYAVAEKDDVMSDPSEPIWIEYQSPIPEIPTASCSNNIITMACETEGAVIYWKYEGDDTWHVYDVPFAITQDVSIITMAEKDGYYSDESDPYEFTYVAPGSGEGEAPAKPEMSIYYNTVTITCPTPNAGLYWMFLTDDTWIEYDGPFEIQQSGYYVPKAVKDGKETLGSVKYFTYTEQEHQKPFVPELVQNVNMITLTCATAGAAIYYKLVNGISWVEYSIPFTIYESGWYILKSVKDGIESDISDQIFCQFYATPAAPTIECENNIVTISTTTAGATIYYKVGNGNWIQYNNYIVLLESGNYYAKAVKDGVSSIITGPVYCAYDSDIDYYCTLPLTFVINTTPGPDDPGHIHWFKTLNCSSDYNLTIEYRIKKNGNYTQWTELISSYNGSSISVDAGDEVEVRGNFDKSPVEDLLRDKRIYFLVHNCTFSLKGNIMSLLSKTDFALLSTIDLNGAFNALFYESGGTLLNIDNLRLPAEILSDSCYASMFSHCDWLTSIPSDLLPSTHLADACYNAMFAGCTGLTSIPVNLLPATTLAPGCYSSMFNGCTGLTSIPSGLLPATTLANRCYELMFDDCANLTSIPSGFLPATTLATYCYAAMFEGCSKLVSLPSNLLPATTLAQSCYVRMFFECRKITTAPQLLAPALVKYCYQLMFYGCTTLNYVYCLAETFGGVNNYSTDRWLNGVASRGTFVKKTNISWPTDAIPTAWTVQNV